MNTRNQYLLMLALVVIMGIGGYFMYQQDKANPAADNKAHAREESVSSKRRAGNSEKS